MHKAVCVVSGGLDSTTMLYKVINEGYVPIVLTFHYGQKHNIEIVYAQNTCDKLGLEHHVISIPALPGSALTEEDIEVPKDVYSVETQKSTVVPNRNAVFLNIAASYAIAYGCEKIYYAAHYNDKAVYPDCTEEFVTKLNSMLQEANYEHIEVVAPFIKMTKADIITLGAKLEVPFEDTWSCYDPVEKVEGFQIVDGVIDTTLQVMSNIHCGVCGTCRERKQAFIEANVDDPTRYAQ